MPRRIIHKNWIYQTNSRGAWETAKYSARQRRIQKEVGNAVAKLSFEEREFVELYWMQGYSFRELANLMGVKTYKLEGLNNRILRKLRSRLADFVAREFGIDTGARYTCPICEHPFKKAIDQLLQTKQPEETYKRIITALRKDFHLIIKTPQLIIGHIKYHTKEE